MFSFLQISFFTRTFLPTEVLKQFALQKSFLRTYYPSEKQKNSVLWNFWHKKITTSTVLWEKDTKSLRTRFIIWIRQEKFPISKSRELISSLKTRRTLHHFLEYTTTSLAWNTKKLLTILVSHYTNLLESVFLGFATDLPELEPSRDLDRLSPFTGLYFNTGENGKHSGGPEATLCYGKCHSANTGLQGKWCKLKLYLF